MTRTIRVIYTHTILSENDTKNLKSYSFLCNEDRVKVGDLLESPMYNTPMQVLEISNSNAAVVKGIQLKLLIISSINSIEKSLLDNIKNNNTEKKSVSSSFIEKYKSQFIPRKEPLLKLSMDGNVCVPVNGEYIAINSKNELCSYPAEMCVDAPIYTVSKPYNQVEVGDIIETNNSFSKVTWKKDNGTLQCLSFSGVSSINKEIKDIILKQPLVRVVVNMFSGMTTGEFNPMLLALATNEEMDMKDLLMIQMIQGNSTGFNPMMLMILNKEGNNSMFETMLMMQMMSGQNPMAGFMNPTKE